MQNVFDNGCYFFFINMIQRKPTSTDRIIPTDSCHPLDYQVAASRCLIHRINSFSLNHVDKEKVTSIVENILHNNSYLITHTSSLIQFLIVLITGTFQNQKDGKFYRMYEKKPFHY